MASQLTPSQTAFLETQSRIPAINITNGVCLGVAVVAVALRLLARYITKVGFAADDWLIVVALILFSGYVAATTFATYHGLGKHIIFVTDAKGLTTATMAVFCFYNTTIPFIKFSILVLYTRLFPQKWFKLTCLGVGAIVFAYSFAQLCLDIWECVPIRKQWEPTIEGFCVNEAAVIIAGGVLNICTDFFMLAMPLPVLWSLQIPTYKKRLLSFIFTVGALACVASIVRLAYASAVNTTDSTYNDLGGLVTSSVEIAVGILAACFPTYKALVNLIIEKSPVLSSWVSRNDNNELELMSATGPATRNKGKGWGKITQETTISQVHQSKVEQRDSEPFGVSNNIGSLGPSRVQGFDENV